MDFFRLNNHKTNRAYFVRHDFLMSLDNFNRQVLMTYFIGSQTPWKMDPADRELYSKLNNK